MSSILDHSILDSSILDSTHFAEMKLKPVSEYKKVKRDVSVQSPLTYDPFGWMLLQKYEKERFDDESIFRKTFCEKDKDPLGLLGKLQNILRGKKDD